MGALSKYRTPKLVRDSTSMGIDLMGWELTRYKWIPSSRWFTFFYTQKITLEDWIITSLQFNASHIFSMRNMSRWILIIPCHPWSYILLLVWYSCCSLDVNPSSSSGTNRRQQNSGFIWKESLKVLHTWQTQIRNPGCHRKTPEPWNLTTFLNLRDEYKQQYFSHNQLPTALDWFQNYTDFHYSSQCLFNYSKEESLPWLLFNQHYKWWIGLIATDLGHPHLYCCVSTAVSANAVSKAQFDVESTIVSLGDSAD